MSDLRAISGPDRESGNKMNIWICAVCQRVLDLHTDSRGASYVHTLQDMATADHEAQPIPAPAGYRGWRCDFCNSDQAEFELPARDFRIPGTGGQNISRGHWAACASCANLIETDRWDELLLRYGPAPMDVMAAVWTLWKALRANITGSIRPLHRGSSHD